MAHEGMYGVYRWLIAETVCAVRCSFYTESPDNQAFAFSDPGSVKSCMRSTGGACDGCRDSSFPACSQMLRQQAGASGESHVKWNSQECYSFLQPYCRNITAPLIHFADMRPPVCSVPVKSAEMLKNTGYTDASIMNLQAPLLSDCAALQHCT